MTAEESRGIFGSAKRLGLPKDKCYRLARGDFKEACEHLWKLHQEQERQIHPQLWLPI